jgi:hypothetical protein
MTSIRRSVDKALPILGIVIVLGAVLFLWCGNLYTQLAVVMIGIFLIEAGIWQLAHPLLPSVRRYRALRKEVDDFIQLVRRLNAAALLRESGDAGGADAIASVKGEMMDSVERMIEYAGKETPEEAA